MGLSMSAYTKAAEYLQKNMGKGDYEDGMSSVKDARRLPLPVGVSDYCLASSEYYYIDKTMMIKDFIDERPQVSLFTRPRRFGKTLNMDMLRTFFEKTDSDTSVIAAIVSSQVLNLMSLNVKKITGYFP